MPSLIHSLSQRYPDWGRIHTARASLTLALVLALSLLSVACNDAIPTASQVEQTAPEQAPRLLSLPGGISFNILRYAEYPQLRAIMIGSQATDAGREVRLFISCLEEGPSFNQSAGERPPTWPRNRITARLFYSAAEGTALGAVGPSNVQWVTSTGDSGGGRWTKHSDSDVQVDISASGSTALVAALESAEFVTFTVDDDQLPDLPTRGLLQTPAQPDLNRCVAAEPPPQTLMSTQYSGYVSEDAQSSVVAATVMVNAVGGLSEGSPALASVTVYCATIDDSEASSSKLDSDFPVQLGVEFFSDTYVATPDGARVHIAFDGEDGQALIWNLTAPDESVSHGHIFAPAELQAQDEFFRRSEDAETVTFSFVVDETAMKTYTFDLDALFSTPVQPYLDTCGQEESIVSAPRR